MTNKKTPKLTWTLSTRDYDIKTYDIYHGEDLIGYVDVEMDDGRISSRVATPLCDGADTYYATSRKDANRYLWLAHLGQQSK